MISDIKSSIDWLIAHNYPIHPRLRAAAIKKGVLHSREIKQALGYQPLRDSLWAAVYDAVFNFLNSNARVDTYKNPLAAEISRVYIETADIAYVDGGGSLPIDEDTASMARLMLGEQLAYIDSLFERLKQLRKEGDYDAINEAFDRASGYATSLDAFYNNIKLSGAGNKMLTFGGSDGRESCVDCTKLKGKRHRASWWRSHGYVPPSREFACGGYHCDHKLFDDDGNVYTI